MNDSRFKVKCSPFLSTLVYPLGSMFTFIQESQILAGPQKRLVKILPKEMPKETCCSLC